MKFRTLENTKFRLRGFDSGLSLVKSLYLRPGNEASEYGGLNQARLRE